MSEDSRTRITISRISHRVETHHPKYAAINLNWFIFAGEDLVSEPTCQSETFARSGNREIKDVGREAAPYGALRFTSGTLNFRGTLPRRNAVSSRLNTSSRDHPASRKGMRVGSLNNTGQKNRWINLSPHYGMISDYAKKSRLKNHVIVKRCNITIENIFFIMIIVLEWFQREKSRIIGFTFYSISLKKKMKRLLKNLCLSSVPISIATVLKRNYCK